MFAVCGEPLRDEIRVIFAKMTVDTGHMLGDTVVKRCEVCLGPKLFQEAQGKTSIVRRRSLPLTNAPQHHTRAPPPATTHTQVLLDSLET